MNKVGLPEGSMGDEGSGAETGAPQAAPSASAALLASLAGTRTTAGLRWAAPAWDCPPAQDTTADIEMVHRQSSPTNYGSNWHHQAYGHDAGL